MGVVEGLEERPVDRVGKVLFGQRRRFARRQFADNLQPHLHGFV
jgi:hypothetical protein